MINTILLAPAIMCTKLQIHLIGRNIWNSCISQRGFLISSTSFIRGDRRALWRPTTLNLTCLQVNTNILRDTYLAKAKITMSTLPSGIGEQLMQMIKVFWEFFWLFKNLMGVNLDLNFREGKDANTLWAYSWVYQCLQTCTPGHDHLFLVKAKEGEIKLQRNLFSLFNMSAMQSKAKQHV